MSEEIVVAIDLHQLPPEVFGVKSKPLEKAAIIMTIMGPRMRFIDKPSDFDERPPRIEFKTRADAEYFFEKFWFQKPMAVIGPLTATNNIDNTTIWNKFSEVTDKAVFVTNQIDKPSRNMELLFVVDREKALQLKLTV